jgi:hypothetical protein
VLRLNEKFERSSLEKVLKETQDIAAATINLNEIIHNLKIQINIAECVSIFYSAQIVLNSCDFCRKKDHPKLYLWSKEWKEEQVVASAAPEMASVASFEPIASTSAAVDDADLHPALKMPLSAMEIEHLATTMAQSIPNSGGPFIKS